MIRILIVGDNPLARAGLSAMLQDIDDFTMVGQVAGDEPLAAYEPDIAVWDIGWNADLQHLTALDTLAFPVLALVPDVEQATDVWAAGVQGLLLRATVAENLVMAIQSVVMGMVVLDADISDQLITLNTMLPIDSDIELTPRESEVLQLLSEGLSNKGIAYNLGISDHTVKFHVNAIMTKLEAQSRTEAAVKAARLGLITL